MIWGAIAPNAPFDSVDKEIMLDNQVAIASISLGQHSSHTLPRKIVAAAQNGLLGLEITYPDLEFYSNSLSIPMLDAAREIKNLCTAHRVRVIALVSFQNFEGHLSPLNERLRKAGYWLAISRALGAEYIQVPSTYDRNINGDHEVIVSELRQLADLAAASRPVIKIAYENLAWSSHCTLWQEALRIVQEVDRENFGLCLDSFHLSIALWADPFTPSGRQPNGDQRLEESLRDFVKNCPLDKIFYIQLSDGEILDQPYSESHPWYDPDLAVGHVWSNEARPFPLETEYGAYMPVHTIAKAFLVDKGFSGWVSLETFDRRMKEEKNDPDQNARRAIKAWQHLRAELLAVNPIIYADTSPQASIEATDIPALRSILRFFTNSRNKKGILDLGNAPVEYMDSMRQRKDEESRSLKDTGNTGHVEGGLQGWFEHLKQLARELRNVLVPIRDRAIFTGTFRDNDIMYNGMIKAFDSAITSAGEEEQANA
ncbi:hypothetical protein VE03_02782 [Pseudogymnoascus sp. 23342-1-I1]|nr:hypothetical protein VE03_02782 [Pseudogymnoascus sp. 23342-1-I1]